MVSVGLLEEFDELLVPKVAAQTPDRLRRTADAAPAAAGAETRAAQTAAADAAEPQARGAARHDQELDALAAEAVLASAARRQRPTAADEAAVSAADSTAAESKADGSAESKAEPTAEDAGPPPAAPLALLALLAAPSRESLLLLRRVVPRGLSYYSGLVSSARAREASAHLRKPALRLRFLTRRGPLPTWAAAGGERLDAKGEGFVVVSELRCGRETRRAAAAEDGARRAFPDGSRATDACGPAAAVAPRRYYFEASLRGRHGPTLIGWAFSGAESLFAAASRGQAPLGLAAAGFAGAGAGLAAFSVNGTRAGFAAAGLTASGTDAAAAAGAAGWRDRDVVGCLLDCGSGVAAFSVNGVLVSARRLDATTLRRISDDGATAAALLADPEDGGANGLLRTPPLRALPFASARFATARLAAPSEEKTRLVDDDTKESPEPSDDDDDDDAAPCRSRLIEGVQGVQGAHEPVEPASVRFNVGHSFVYDAGGRTFVYDAEALLSAALLSAAHLRADATATDDLFPPSPTGAAAAAAAAVVGDDGATRPPRARRVAAACVGASAAFVQGVVACECAFPLESSESGVTLEFVLRPQGAGAVAERHDEKGGFAVHLEDAPGDGRLRLVLCVVVIDGKRLECRSNACVRPGEWIHLCVTWRSGSGIAAVYVDGERVPCTASDEPTSGVSRACVSRTGWPEKTLGFCAPGGGDLAEVRIWMEACTPVQLRPPDDAPRGDVASRAHRGAVDGDQGLAALWPMDEGFGALARSVASAPPSWLAGPLALDVCAKWVDDADLEEEEHARRDAETPFQESPALGAGDAAFGADDAVSRAVALYRDSVVATLAATDDGPGGTEDVVRRLLAKRASGAAATPDVGGAMHAHLYLLASACLVPRDDAARRVRCELDAACCLVVGSGAGEGLRALTLVLKDLAALEFSASDAARRADALISGAVDRGAVDRGAAEEPDGDEETVAGLVRMLAMVRWVRADVRRALAAPFAQGATAPSRGTLPPEANADDTGRADGAVSGRTWASLFDSLLRLADKCAQPLQGQAVPSPSALSVEFLQRAVREDAAAAISEATGLLPKRAEKTAFAIRCARGQVDAVVAAAVLSKMANDARTIDELVPSVLRPALSEKRVERGVEDALLLDDVALFQNPPQRPPKPGECLWVADDRCAEPNRRGRGHETTRDDDASDDDDASAVTDASDDSASRGFCRRRRLAVVLRLEKNDFGHEKRRDDADFGLFRKLRVAYVGGAAATRRLDGGGGGEADAGESDAGEAVVSLSECCVCGEGEEENERVALCDAIRGVASEAWLEARGLSWALLRTETAHDARGPRTNLRADELLEVYYSAAVEFDDWPLSVDAHARHSEECARADDLQALLQTLAVCAPTGNGFPSKSAFLVDVERDAARLQEAKTALLIKCLGALAPSASSDGADGVLLGYAPAVLADVVSNVLASGTQASLDGVQAALDAALRFDALDAADAQPLLAAVLGIARQVCGVRGGRAPDAVSDGDPPSDDAARGAARHLRASAWALASRCVDALLRRPASDNGQLLGGRLISRRGAADDATVRALTALLHDGDGLLPRGVALLSCEEAEALRVLDRQLVAAAPASLRNLGGVPLRCACVAVALAVRSYAGAADVAGAADARAAIAEDWGLLTGLRMRFTAARDSSGATYADTARRVIANALFLVAKAAPRHAAAFADVAKSVAAFAFDADGSHRAALEVAMDAAAVTVARRKAAFEGCLVLEELLEEDAFWEALSDKLPATAHDFEDGDLLGRVAAALRHGGKYDALRRVAHAPLRRPTSSDDDDEDDDDSATSLRTRRRDEAMRSGAEASGGVEGESCVVLGLALASCDARDELLETFGLLCDAVGRALRIAVGKADVGGVKRLLRFFGCGADSTFDMARLRRTLSPDGECLLRRVVSLGVDQGDEDVCKAALILSAVFVPTSLYDAIHGALGAPTGAFDVLGHATALVLQRIAFDSDEALTTPKWRCLFFELTSQPQPLVQRRGWRLLGLSLESLKGAPSESGAFVPLRAGSDAGADVGADVDFAAGDIATAGEVDFAAVATAALATAAAPYARLCRDAAFDAGPPPDAGEAPPFASGAFESMSFAGESLAAAHEAAVTLHKLLRLSSGASGPACAVLCEALENLQYGEALENLQYGELHHDGASTALGLGALAVVGARGPFGCGEGRSGDDSDAVENAFENAVEETYPSDVSVARPQALENGGERWTGSAGEKLAAGVADCCARLCVKVSEPSVCFKVARCLAMRAVLRLATTSDELAATLVKALSDGGGARLLSAAAGSVEATDDADKLEALLDATLYAQHPGEAQPADDAVSEEGDEVSGGKVAAWPRLFHCHHERVAGSSPRPGGVALRAAPRTSAPQIGRLGPGGEVLAYGEAAGWLRLRLGPPPRAAAEHAGSAEGTRSSAEGFSPSASDSSATTTARAGAAEAPQFGRRSAPPPDVGPSMGAARRPPSDDFSDLTPSEASRQPEAHAPSETSQRTGLAQISEGIFSESSDSPRSARTRETAGESPRSASESPPAPPGAAPPAPPGRPVAPDDAEDRDDARLTFDDEATLDRDAETLDRDDFTVDEKTHTSEISPTDLDAADGTDLDRLSCLGLTQASTLSELDVCQGEDDERSVVRAGSPVSDVTWRDVVGPAEGNFCWAPRRDSRGMELLRPGPRGGAFGARPSFQACQTSSEGESAEDSSEASSDVCSSDVWRFAGLEDDSGAEVEEADSRYFADQSFTPLEGLWRGADDESDEDRRPVTRRGLAPGAARGRFLRRTSSAVDLLRVRVGVASSDLLRVRPATLHRLCELEGLRPQRAFNRPPLAPLPPAVRRASSKSAAALADALYVVRAREVVLALALHCVGDGGARLRRLLSDGDRLAADHVCSLAKMVFEREPYSWIAAEAVPGILGSGEPLSFPLGSATHRALLTPVVQHLLTSDDGAFAREVIQLVQKELRGAVDASLRRPTRQRETPRQGRGSLAFAQWATRAALACGSSSLANPRRLMDSEKVALFEHWTCALSSKCVLVKQHVLSELARMLSQHADAERADGSKRVLQACLRLLPLQRLKAAAALRLLREADNDPVASRYLQALLDVVATAEAVPPSLATAEAVPPSLEEHPQNAEAASLGEKQRFCLRLGCGGAMRVGARDCPPPWTAEFVVFRSEVCDSSSVGDSSSSSAAFQNPSDASVCDSSSEASDDSDASSSDEDSSEASGESLSFKPMQQWLPRISLASSTNGAIELQRGGPAFGALFDGELEAVADEARCVCIGGNSFDYVVPAGKWIHLAFVARDASGGKAKHVVDLYVEGVLVDTVHARVSLPCGAVGREDALGGAGAKRAPRRRDRGEAPQPQPPSPEHGAGSPPCAKLPDQASSGTLPHQPGQSSSSNPVDDAARCGSEHGERRRRKGFERAPAELRIASVRYWCVARSQADLGRCLHSRAYGGARGLLGSWDLTFDDFANGDVPASRAFLGVDSTDQHESCLFRGNAKWARADDAPRFPPFEAGAADRKEDEDRGRDSESGGDEDGDGDLVLRGTTLRRALPQFQTGNLARPRTESFLLRLRRCRGSRAAGSIEYPERGIVCAVEGCFNDDGTAVHVKATRVVEGNDLDAVDGSTLRRVWRGPGRPPAGFKYVAEPQPFAAANCCSLSPLGAVITAKRVRVADGDSVVDDGEAWRDHGAGGLAAQAGAWRGKVLYAERLVRVRRPVGLWHVDEANLPSKIFATDTPSQPRRRLISTVSFGGKFKAVATLRTRGDVEDSDDPTSPAFLQTFSRLEHAPQGAADAPHVEAGLYALRARNAAASAAAALLDVCSQDSFGPSTCTTAERTQVAVAEALRLAVRAAQLRASLGAAPLPLDEAAVVWRRRSAGADVGDGPPLETPPPASSSPRRPWLRPATSQPSPADNSTLARPWRLESRAEAPGPTVDDAPVDEANYDRPWRLTGQAAVDYATRGANSEARARPAAVEHERPWRVNTRLGRAANNEARAALDDAARSADEAQRCLVDRLFADSLSFEALRLLTSPTPPTGASGEYVIRAPRTGLASLRAPRPNLERLASEPVAAGAPLVFETVAFARRRACAPDDLCAGCLRQGRCVLASLVPEGAAAPEDGVAAPEDARLAVWGVGRRYKCCWEWLIRRVSSGDVGVGLIELHADPLCNLGDDLGWVYKSTGLLAHGGVTFSAAPTFGAGDVIGVELDLDDESQGSVRFYKNGVALSLVAAAGMDAALQLPVDLGDAARSPARGRVAAPRAVRGKAWLRPAVHFGGAGDGVVAFGAKEGFGERKYVTDAPSRLATTYAGEWLKGARQLGARRSTRRSNLDRRQGRTRRPRDCRPLRPRRAVPELGRGGGCRPSAVRVESQVRRRKGRQPQGTATWAAGGGRLSPRRGRRLRALRRGL
ncbi:hypothetical protein M885DRAFT_297769 [Pelagophyceae sp. CCMP2097]|nr:hypothetical protein M885DRAFT_297769 [Pelagophyceae sp. CCMP2097]